MPERIAAAIRQEPKRGFGLAVGVAVLIAVIVLSIGVFSGSSGAAAKVQRARAHHAGASHDRGGTASLSSTQITPTSIGS